MRVLTLKQPWASLLVMGVKEWETRSWKPSVAMQHLLRTEGFLIHASAAFDKNDQSLLAMPPFCGVIKPGTVLPVGKIIGWAQLGRIVTTSDWIKENMTGQNMRAPMEHAFGDYSPGRWAWQIKRTEQFDDWDQIRAKGSLSLWNFTGQLPKTLKLFTA